MNDENMSQGLRRGRESGGKRKRQTVLDSLLNSPTPAPPQVEHVLDKMEMTNALTPTQFQELEAARETYLAKWGEACDAHHRRQLTRGKQAEAIPDETDLDSKALHFVNAFLHVMRMALACDAAIPSQFLDCLVLVVRNDPLHKRIHASQLAHDALIMYVQARGYAKVQNAEGDVCSQPRLLINNTAAWLPLSEDRNSFASKYLLLHDILAAGKLYHAQSTLGGHTSSRYLPPAFASPLDLLIQCVDNILRDLTAEDMGSSHRANADLYMLHYLSFVIREDANARIRLHDILQSQSQAVDESQRNKSPFDQSISQRSALLSNSLIWRIFGSPFSEKKAQESFVRGLVRLITSRSLDGSYSSFHNVKGPEEEEVTVRSTLSSHLEIQETAKILLQTMLDILGRAEGNSAFFCNSKHRKSSSNLRMSIDSFLIDAFWSEKGYCKEPEDARVLLQAICPRDRLRFLGLMVAHKFARTYSSNVLITKSSLEGADGQTSFADITKYMHWVNDMMVSNHGKDIDGSFEVDMTQVLMALNYEPNRAVKTYKSINHVALMLEVIASAVYALWVRQEAIPTGFHTLNKFGEELKKAAVSFATASKEHHDVAFALTSQAACDLAITLNVTKSISA